MLSIIQTSDDFHLYARGLVLLSLLRSLSELFPAHEALNYCTLGYSRSVDPEHSEPQDCSSYRLFFLPDDTGKKDEVIVRVDGTDS